MESVLTCCVCGGGETVKLFEKKDKFGCSPTPFTVVECRSCGLGYIHPRPDEQEIGRFYPETYSWKEGRHSETGSRNFLSRLEKFYRFHLLEYETAKVIRRTGKSTGRVLDIGCGTGDRLTVFQAQGFETFGVEPSESAEEARKKAGLQVTGGNLFQAGYPREFFDFVTLYNVLEHLHDPSQTLREIARILKPEGALVIEVPNKDCFQYRLFRKRWAAFDVPRDLFYFNPNTLGRLLGQSGFRVRGFDFFNNLWHPPTLAVSLFPALDPQLAWYGQKQGNPTVHLKFLWVIATFFAAPFAFLESVFQRPALMTVYAEKVKVC